jgi:hypothetical protein
MNNAESSTDTLRARLREMQATIEQQRRIIDQMDTGLSVMFARSMQVLTWDLSELQRREAFLDMYPSRVAGIDYQH